MGAIDREVTSLDLAIIGNGRIAALVDASASIVWCCVPRFDGDPVFCSLLGGGNPGDGGSFAITLEGAVRSEQEYLTNTPILVTRHYDQTGGGVEITDFCPRHAEPGALLPPPFLVRQVRPIGGRPSIRVSVNPKSDYGCKSRQHSIGGNHISYEGDQALRLTTDAPIGSIVDGSTFHLKQTITLMFGLDEPVAARSDVTSIGTAMLEQTQEYWLVWWRNLQLPAEWSDAAIRAAITLELNAYEPTGAIIPAVTTSIPEAPDTGRTWDYRYCWPRDAYFTAAALSRMNQLRSVESYLRFLLDVADRSEDSRLVPIYDLDGGPIPAERVASCLPGYRGMGPVRVGNKASEQAQHDLYGEAVLTAERLFSDSRRVRPDDNPRDMYAALLKRLEPFGGQAAQLYDKPDAGLWELRGAERVHTFSSLMCWVACDRLSKYAKRAINEARSNFWREKATTIRETIMKRSWNEKLNAFTATMDGDSLDASLLLMPRFDFVSANDPRFVGTVSAIEKQLKHGDFVYRYVERDDFGFPENAFLVCTFWYIEALAAMGGARRKEARALFEKVLSARNRHGLLAEDLDPQTLEQWGNFPQTYCMAGIIDCAFALAGDAKNIN